VLGVRCSKTLPAEHKQLEHAAQAVNRHTSTCRHARHKNKQAAL
jgi:hypothetical protein